MSERAFRWLNIGNGEPMIVMPYSRCALPNAFGGTADESVEGPTKIGCVIDTETTGRNKLEDTVIEIGVRTFICSEDGKVLWLQERYDALNDPGEPLPEEIVKLTGITDADVAGQKIDRAAVRRLIESSSFVIAHNASFDRPFVDSLFVDKPDISEPLSPRRWVCSIEEIDWKGFGLPSQALVALCMAHGFYTDAHRAGNDAEALVKLLSLRNAESGRTYLSHLLESMEQDWVKIMATGAPFERKDALKERGYRWDADAKVWHRTMPSSKREEEVAWLHENATRRPTVKVLDPMERYR